MSAPIKYRPCTNNAELQFLAVMIKEQEVKRDQAERDFKLKNLRYGPESVVATNAGSVHLQQYLIWEALLEKMSRWIDDLAKVVVADYATLVPPVPAKRTKRKT